MNKFQIEEGEKRIIFKHDPEGENRQNEKLEKLRSGRDAALVEDTLIKLKSQAEDPDGEIFPYILDAVRAESTIGEICDTLRAVFGVFKPAL